MVEGTVGKVDDRLRVTVSLVNVADEAVLWSQRYDVTEKELYALQDSAAAAIASALGVGLARRADAGLAPHRTANPEAHDLVLRGQFLVEQSTETGLRQAIALFERAAALDSTYADPWNGIAQAWFFLADTYLAPRAAVPPMRAAIDKALALDPASAWAHALNGVFAQHLSPRLRRRRTGVPEGDRAGQHHDIRRRLWMAAVRARPGRFGAGRGAPRAAAQSLRLRADRIWRWSSSAISGMLDSATAACQALLRLAASDNCEERLLLQRGRAAEVVAARKATPPADPADMLFLAEALARAGDTAAARRQLSAALIAAGTRYVREDYVASVYLALGDTARAGVARPGPRCPGGEHGPDQPGLEIQAAARQPGVRGHRAESGAAAVAMTGLAAGQRRAVDRGVELDVGVTGPQGGRDSQMSGALS